MLLTLVALSKHTESMYFTFFRQSLVTHVPAATPAVMSLHQPSTRAERSFGRFWHDWASHCPRESHSFGVSARPGSLDPCLAATPVEFGEEGGGVPLAQAAVV